MKKSGFIAASVAAASATAASATTTSASFSFNSRNPLYQNYVQEEGTSKGREESTDKFAPRFDGLKFIETLVTAHR